MARKRALDTQRKTHQPSLASRLITILSFLICAMISWSFWDLPSWRADRLLPTGYDLWDEVQKLQFTQIELNKSKMDGEKITQFGKDLFFDQRFSGNQKISCAHCHKPEYQFTDPLPKAQAIGDSHRRTPSIVNSVFNSWFFWDGRADSLESQAMGPIEHPDEHGISRLKVAHLIHAHYLETYEHLFGPLGIKLDSMPEHALPKPSEVQLSHTIGAYSLASIDSFSVMDSLLRESSRNGVSPSMMVSKKSNPTPTHPEAWYNNWEKLNEQDREAINLVFINFAKAIAAYEKGITSTQSPFDRFAHRLAESKGNAQGSLSEEFGPQELLGLQIFVGTGRCTTCHSGANFTDQQFHNVGLPIVKKDLAEFIDSGRAFGALLIQQNQFNCLGPYSLGRLSESCKELPWLDSENLELVGAFKTPSLRNVAERPPYMHDGRFKSLEEVIDHYNRADDEPYIGHREETLLPLHLNQAEKKALVSFLKSLTSPIFDRTSPDEKLSTLSSP